MDATNYAANPAVTVGLGAEMAQGEMIRYQHENAMGLMNSPVHLLTVILGRMRGVMLMFRPRRAVDTGMWSAECWRTPTTFGGTRPWFRPVLSNFIKFIIFSNSNCDKSFYAQRPS